MYGIFGYTCGWCFDGKCRESMVSFFFNVGKNGGSQATSKANRLILLASIEQEPGDLQRQVWLVWVGLLQSLTSKAT